MALQLPEDDEEERMQYGEDVEPFIAALTQDGVLSHGSNSRPNQLFTTWQESNQEENLNVKNNNAEVKISQRQEQTSSDEQMTQHGSCCEKQEQPVGNLHEENALKEVGDSPPLIGEKPSEDDTIKYEEWEIKNPEYTSWEKKYNHWYQQYVCTASFIFGFQAKVPKVYVVTSKYEIPADISKNFSLQDYKEGITKAMDELAVYLTSFPHNHVLGSSRPFVREYIDRSEYFKRRISFCDHPTVVEGLNFIFGIF
ncbi:hypothetical protein FRX31_029134 [Thalictrum thalictroides]|uniref:Uncharacterized protein n=1 Tax=Thalictrum thalictroides TaxID=46969 RepID=A0A7J6V8J4_THATH|nr:hypothetical protein FRX31_029134 [Thalictrum thalictroides]